MNRLRYRRMLTTALCLCFAITMTAHDFGCRWISSPQPDSTSYVWFRRMYLSDGRPRLARLAVASTGFYRVYVNAMNVGTAFFYPQRGQGDTTAVQLSFDITRYLRPDTNVVAIAYAPTFPHISRRQIAVACYGLDHNGTAFSHFSDDSWLCRPANVSLNSDGGETIDGSEHNTTWTTTCFDPALWVSAQPFSEQEAPLADNSRRPFPTPFRPLPAFGLLPSAYTAPVVSQIVNDTHADWAESSADSLSVIHRQTIGDSIIVTLPAGFYGCFRVTLRGAHRGETVQIGQTQYICRGDLDEQACAVFAMQPFGGVIITGDRRFRPSQVTTIEAVVISERNFSPW